MPLLTQLALEMQCWPATASARGICSQQWLLRSQAVAGAMLTHIVQYHLGQVKAPLQAYCIMLHVDSCEQVMCTTAVHEYQ